MFWAFILVPSLLLVPVVAQFAGIDISQVPTCAQGCLANNTNTATGCSITDIKCLCQSTPFINAISCCLQNSCSTTDQQAALAFDIKLCNTYNVSIPDFIGCSPLGSSLSYAGSAATGSRGLGTVMSSTSTVTNIAPAFTTTGGGPVATFAGNAIMTSSCTSPYIASYPLPSGGVLEFPWVGCSNQEPGCCPFDLGAEGPLTVCPHDYVTISDACCPNGWAVYSSTIAGQLPCFTLPALPLAPPPITGSTGPAPTVISSQLFTLRYQLQTLQPGLSIGAQAGIGVGAAVGALLLALLTVFIIRRRQHARAVRAATIPRSVYEAPQDFTPKTPASQFTFGSTIASTSPQTPIRSEMPNSPAPMSPTRSILQEVRPATPVMELPGSNFLHEHHPAYNQPGSPTITSEDTPTSQAGEAAIATISSNEKYRPPFASVEKISEIQERTEKSEG